MLCKQHSAKTPEHHLIDCHRFAALGRVEERSLSSILRSRLLSTLINNDVSGEVNARACVRRLDNLVAMNMCFASGSAKKKAVFEKVADEKI